MIMQVYAPMSAYDDDLAEEFYKQFESTVKEIPMKDLIIQGDWNARVGPYACEQWAGMVARFGVGETMEIGELKIAL